MNRRLWAVALAAGSLATVAGVAVAYQGAKPASAPQASADSGTVDFWTKVGSFKILSPNQDVKARGKITMNFQGTVLIVGLEGTATPGGAVKVQYQSPQQARTVYFGRGTLTIDGKWRAIQFFGRDFKGSWTGMGIMRLYGEFDDKLDTGTFVVKGQPKEPWGNGGRQVFLPPPVMPGAVKPKIDPIKPAQRGG